MSRFSNIHEIILAAAARWGAHTVFRHIRSGSVREIQYKDLPRITALFANKFASLGLEKGDFIVICADNCPEWVVTAIGAWRQGVVVIPLDARSRKDDLQPLLKNVKPKLFLLGKTQYGLLAEYLPQDKVRDFETFVSEMSKEKPSGLGPLNKIGHDDPALMVFTSGSSGVPKGVLLSHGNVLSNVQAVVERFDVTNDDRLLSILPLSHMFEMVAGLLGPMVKGATIVQSRIRGPEHLRELLRMEKISIIIGVPALYQNILDGINREIATRSTGDRFKIAVARNAVLSQGLLGVSLARVVFKELHKKLGGKIKFWAVGGAPVSPDLVKSFASFGIPVLAGYGLTETAPIVSCNTRFTNRPGTVGKPLPDVEIRIEPSQQQQPVAGSEVINGEIVVKGPNVMLGYYGDKAATDAVLQDGWLHTGDIGHMDEEGYLHVTGRKKNLIVTPGGYNVHPEEVERALERSPKIKQAFVIGKAEPAGEQVFAIIVPEKNGSGQEEIVHHIREEVKASLADLAEYKRLAGYEIYDRDLPKTPAGKINRIEAAKIFDSLISQKPIAVAKIDDTRWDEVGKLVCNHIARVVARSGNAQQFTEPLWYAPASTISGTLGIDSFARMELAMQLEEEFGFEIPEETMNDVSTVEDLVALVKYHKRQTEDAGYDAKSSQEAAFKRALQTYEHSEHDELAELKGKVEPWPMGSKPALLLNVQDQPFTVATRKSMVVFARMMMQIYNEFTVEGADRLALDPPFIVCANHTSHLDTFALLASFPANLVRYVHPVAAQDTFFTDRLSASLSANVLNAIPFDRYGDFEKSLTECEQVLRKGEILIVFPEGTRSMDGKMGKFKSGAARLAVDTGSPIVPAYIKGTYDALPKGKKLPASQRISVKFGTPIYPPSGATDVSQCLALTRQVQAAVEALRS
jgi:long-chain acyl-CoA synthetase